MGKILIFVLPLMFSMHLLKAQEKFQISGRVNGIANGILHLVTEENGEKDTLASAPITNGAFMLTGKVGAPRAAYVVIGGQAMEIPLILENADFMLNVSERGALVQGGEQQKLFTRYSQIAQTFAGEQARVQAEARRDGADIQALQERIDRAYKESMDRMMELVKANPDAYATAYMISLGSLDETEESLRYKYDLLGENAKSSVPGKRVAKALARYAALAVGNESPNFTASRPNGDAFALHDVPAKIKLLVFWASWDDASRWANPELIKLYRQFRPKGFEIVSVSLDSDRFEWERAIEQDGLIWTNGCDFRGTGSGVAELYMVGNVLPYTILIDRENRIVAKGLWGVELRQHISDLAKKTKRE